jgi:DNA-binding transcriptional MerR regulator
MTTIKAFTTQQVTGLAKISERQLRYWEETDVFSPTFVDAVMPGPYRKIYSFRDLVTLRTLGLLRNQHGVVLDELRRTSGYLRAHPGSSWPALGLRLHGHHVAFRDPESGEWVSAEPLGQRVLPLDLDEIVRESERAAQGLFSRSPEDVGKVTRNRNVMSNAPRVCGHAHSG